jgi:hypothetical protein
MRPNWKLSAAVMVLLSANTATGQDRTTTPKDVVFGTGLTMSFANPASGTSGVTSFDVTKFGPTVANSSNPDANAATLIRLNPRLYPEFVTGKFNLKKPGAWAKFEGLRFIAAMAAQVGGYEVFARAGPAVQAAMLRKYMNAQLPVMYPGYGQGRPMTRAMRDEIQTFYDAAVAMTRWPIVGLGPAPAVRLPRVATGLHLSAPPPSPRFARQLPMNVYPTFIEPLPSSNLFSSLEREFGGYACASSCRGHAAGYRWMEARDGFGLCPMDPSPSFYEGCMTYLADPFRGADEDDAGNQIR